MQTLFATLLIIGVVMTAMSIGVMLTGRRLKGSCGGTGEDCACDEEARLADYDDAGEVTNERLRKYGYLLLRSAVGDPVREFRQDIAKDELRHRYCSERSVFFPEIQLDRDSVGIFQENLVQRHPGHVPFGERCRSPQQAFAIGLYIIGPKCDVIQRAGSLLRRTLAADQMDHRPVAAVEPGAGKIERRPIAVPQTQNVGIKRDGALQVRRVDGEVVQGLHGHR